MLLQPGSAPPHDSLSGQFFELFVRVFSFYALHLTALVGAYLLLWRHARRAQTPPLVPWAVALTAGSAFVFLVSEPQSEWFGDFVEAYYQGGAAALQGLDEVPKGFDRGVHGFVNIPILALPFAPFALLPKMASAIVYSVLGVGAIVACFRTLVRELSLDRHGATLVALLFALNGPLHNSLREGNTSHFALWAVTVAFFALQRGREWTAGLVIGIAALFKLPLLLFGLYFVVRLRIRAAAGIALVIGVVGGASVLLFGLPAHLTWYERFVASAGQQPMGAFNVQSIAALMLRFDRAGEVICDWSGFAPSPLGQALARVASVSLLLVAVAACLLPALRHGWATLKQSDLQRVEFLIVFVLCCLVSPLAWSHYYCWMLLPLTLLLADSALLITGSALLITGSAPSIAGSAPSITSSAPSITSSAPPITNNALRPLPTHAAAGYAWRANPLTKRETWIALAVILVSAPVLRAWCSPSGLAKVPYLIALSHYLWGGLLAYVLLLSTAWRCGTRGAQRDAP